MQGINKAAYTRYLISLRAEEENQRDIALTNSGRKHRPEGAVKYHEARIDLLTLLIHDLEGR